MWLLLFFVTASAQQPCISRNYGNGGTVCVCNITYCDSTPPPTKVPPSEYLVYTSNLAGLRFQKTTGIFQSFDSCLSNAEIDVEVLFQSVFGFGGAFTDSVGINIKTLPNSMQEMLLQSYFCQNGLQYNMGRVPIGGTDFSVRAYSYDDGPPDPHLVNFSLQPEDHLDKIPFIKRAVKMSDNNLLLFGTAWTAPKWMKTNHNFSGYGFIQKCYYQSWAEYHLKFLEEYQKCGVNFWGITTGNEPFDALIPHENLEVVGWTHEGMAQWISENLGPTIRNSTFGTTNLLIFEDQRAFLPWFLQKVFRNRIARKYIDGIAVHWYLDELVPASHLTKTKKLFPEKFILASEACNGFRKGDVHVLLGSWERGENYTSDIIEDMNNWAVGWMDWNMALNLQGGPNYIQNYVDSPIIINATSSEFYKQPMYYHLGHFSKFVPRDSKRIEFKVEEKTIQAIAFQRPDNGTAVILLNRSEAPVSVNLKDSRKGIAQIEITARSVNTVLYW